MCRHGQSNPNLSLLQDLMGDDLLIEILSRIPTPLLAFRCKLVCKRWCSLISSPRFITSFVGNKRNLSEYMKPLGVLGIKLNSGKYKRMVRLDFKNPEFSFVGFNLGFLPEKRESVTVRATCNDLILCQAGNYYNPHKSYYLCNPLTMQWVHLPPPSPLTRPKGYAIFGLICEPYPVRGVVGGEINVNFEYRYRVVRFCFQEKGYGVSRVTQVETYHSETGQWIQSALCGPQSSIISNVAAHNGKLHWVTLSGYDIGRYYLVTYDSFNNGETSVIAGPDYFFIPPERDGRFNVGECNGVLRVMRIRFNSHDCVYKDFSVWDMESDQNGRGVWSLKHSVAFGTIPRIKEIMEAFVIDMYLGISPKRQGSCVLVIFWDYGLVQYGNKRAQSRR